VLSPHPIALRLWDEQGRAPVFLIIVAAMSVLRNLLNFILLVLLLTTMPIGSLAGKPVKTHQEAEEAGLVWLHNLMAEEDIKQLLKEFPDVQGKMHFDLTLHAKGQTAPNAYGRGRVQTAFLADTNIEDHQFTGRFREYLKSKKFDWKMPKGMQVKISYSFDIQ
jgi:hypothetical protein